MKHFDQSEQRLDSRPEHLGVPVNVGLGVGGGEQGHVVERGEQHPAVEGPQVHQPLEVLVHGGRCGGAVAPTIS